MADTAIIALLAVLTLLPLLFSILLFQRLVYIMFFLVMLILSGVGYIMTTGLTTQPIFEMFGIISLVGLPITLLMLVLEILQGEFKLMRGKA